MKIFDIEPRIKSNLVKPFRITKTMSDWLKTFLELLSEEFATYYDVINYINKCNITIQQLKEENNKLKEENNKLKISSKI